MGGVARLALAGLFTAMISLSGVAAQEISQSPSVLTIDPERLFAETSFGRRATQSVEESASELAAENRRIEAELIAEERDLTERRESLSIEEFRKLADAFDEKVDRIRSEQDTKARDVQSLREDERQRFFRQVSPHSCANAVGTAGAGGHGPPGGHCGV